MYKGYYGNEQINNSYLIFKFECHSFKGLYHNSSTSLKDWIDREMKREKKVGNPNEISERIKYSRLG